MAISTQISRLASAADIIKKKTSALGLLLDDGTTIQTTDTLDKQAEAIDNIQTSSISEITLKDSSYTISCKQQMMVNDITVPAVNIYYTGNDTPADTLGNDGDLYLVV